MREAFTRKAVTKTVSKSGGNGVRDAEKGASSGSAKKCVSEGLKLSGR